MSKEPENPFGHEAFLVHAGRHRLDPEGEHYVFKFPNGYGLSVIRTHFSYGNELGCWEAALMRAGENGKLELFINSNVPGFSEDGVYVCSSEEEVTELIERMECLPGLE